MAIKKFLGKTQEDATAKAKEELGGSCVIMSVKENKPTGLFKAFKSSTFEVTAAIEESEFRFPTKPLEEMSVKSKINLSANEDISEMLKGSRTTATKKDEPSAYVRQNMDSTNMYSQKQNNLGKLTQSAVNSNMNEFEERLVNLQSILEERLTPAAKETEQADVEKDAVVVDQMNSANIRFVKVLYNTLLDNEVSERYANQLIDEMDRVLTKSSSVDVVLSHIYQKMILKFGQPSQIDLTGKKPKVVFFVGPTGVGKTTTIAKIASKLKVEDGKKIALLTADTYRIAAEEQLRTYANILDTPLTIIYSAEEIDQAVQKASDTDVILVDTAGFSHKSTKQKEDTRDLIASLSSEYEKEVFLVLSATTKYRDLVEIAEAYREISDYKLIFTKLDETSVYGNLYNIRLHTGAEMSYVTYGQNVPDDIDVFDTQKVVKKLLGGK